MQSLNVSASLLRVPTRMLVVTPGARIRCARATAAIGKQKPPDAPTPTGAAAYKVQ